MSLVLLVLLLLYFQETFKDYLEKSDGLENDLYAGNSDVKKCVQELASEFRERPGFIVLEQK